MVVLGRSFGSGVAACVASWNQPAMLILDSPYYSFKKLIKRHGFILPLRWLLRYIIPTNQFLKVATCPIHIIHGTKDNLIPYAHGKLLAEEFPEKVEFHSIQGGITMTFRSFLNFTKPCIRYLQNQEFLIRRQKSRRKRKNRYESLLL